MCTPYLRDHQVDALRDLQRYFDANQKYCTIILPTGAGKTGIIVFAMYLYCKTSCIVLAPGLQIRDQLAVALASSAKNPQDPFAETFFAKANMFVNLPYDERKLYYPSICIDHPSAAALAQDVYVANAQKFSAPTTSTTPAAGPAPDHGDAALADADADEVQSRRKRTRRSQHHWLDTMNPACIDLLIVDEAHHFPAAYWDRVVQWAKRNTSCRVLFLTASPCRTDKQNVISEDNVIAHHLPFQVAVNRHIIRKAVLLPPFDGTPAEFLRRTIELCQERQPFQMPNGQS